jgi:hypothetical protein
MKPLTIMFCAEKEIEKSDSILNCKTRSSNKIIEKYQNGVSEIQMVAVNKYTTIYDLSFFFLYDQL